MNKICIVSTIKAPLDQTIYFVNYHLNIGIDYIIIFFDDPHDDAIKYLEKYEQVKCIICNDDYWAGHDNAKDFSHVERQIINANLGLNFAKKENCQWIIHIDSDEILYPHGNINNILSSYDGDELRFIVNEAVPEKIRYCNIFSPTLFKKPINRLQKLFGRLLCRQSFFEGEYFRGHLISKAAIRISDKINSLTIHHADYNTENISVDVTPQILLLHFDCIGIEDWKTKWHNKAQVTSPEKLKRLRKNRMRQLEVFINAEISGEDEMIKKYCNLHFIPKREMFILKLLGMLHTIEIDKVLFNPPPDTYDMK